MTFERVEIGACSIITADVIDGLRSLPDGSVHCAVTSPPYWGLRNYQVAGQIGLEKSPEEWCARLVDVFREVRRVLRDDGTFWLNVGDAYNSVAGNYRGIVQGIKGEAGSTLTGGMKRLADKAYRYNARRAALPSLQSGDLIGLPWLLAFALRADGWLLRSAIVWAKGVSFCETYSGSVMPESVSGTRWERCRVKTKDGIKHSGGTRGNANGDFEASLHTEGRLATWADCPGCPKCSPHGGYILRRGSGRPTSGYEMVFLLAKRSGYFYDLEATKETSADIEATTRRYESEFGGNKMLALKATGKGNTHIAGVREFNGTRNLRNVWLIGSEPYREAHFATYPTALVAPCIKAGTSERGVCPKCGAGWARVVEKKPGPMLSGHQGFHAKGDSAGMADMSDNPRFNWESRTLGWRPACTCNVGEPVPATVLDPFGGSGTTGAVATRLGRKSILIELNPAYVEMAKKRVSEAQREHPEVFEGGPLLKHALKEPQLFGGTP